MDTYCDQVWPLTGYMPMYCPGFPLDDVIDLTLPDTDARFACAHSPTPGLSTRGQKNGRTVRIAPGLTVANSNDNKNIIMCDRGKLCDGSDQSSETLAFPSLPVTHGDSVPSPALVSIATSPLSSPSYLIIPEPLSETSTKSPRSSKHSSLHINQSTEKKVRAFSSCVCCVLQPQLCPTSDTSSNDASGLCDNMSTASRAITSTPSSYLPARRTRYTPSPPPLWPASPRSGSSGSPYSSPTHDARRSPSPPPLWPPSPPLLSPSPVAMRDAHSTIEIPDALSENSGPTSSSHSSSQSSRGLSSSHDSGFSSSPPAHFGETSVGIGYVSVDIDYNSDIEELSVDISLEGRRKKRKKRPWPNRYSQTQVQTLQKTFDEYPYPDYMTMEAVSKEIYLTVKQVRKWFANRRRIELKKALVKNSTG